MTAKHGLAAEANPVVVGLAEQFGLPGLTIAKLGSVAFLAAVVVLAAPQRRKIAGALVVDRHHRGHGRRHLERRLDLTGRGAGPPSVGGGRVPPVADILQAAPHGVEEPRAQLAVHQAVVGG